MNDQDFSNIFSKNLIQLLNKHNMTQADLAHKIGVSTATTSNWCKGIKLPRMDKVDKMCDIFDCYRSDLLENKGYLLGKKKSNGFIIKVLGRVAAGIPIDAIEEIIDTEEISEELARTGDFFGLLVKGDSMEPRICDGDVVIVRQQDDADSGDIVIAMVNGDDAVCKRLVKYTSSIALVSLNTKYEPMMFTNEDIETKPVRIIGKVVELRGKL